MSSEVWIKTEAAVPRTAVQMIPVDSKGNVLLMHRSPKVRSAANVWSFPSGLHDIGERWWETGTRELIEEYGLDARHFQSLGIYENISGDEPSRPQWHWVIILAAVLVEDVTVAVNKEPDKHDIMQFIPIEVLQHSDFTRQYPFHQSFTRFFKANQIGLVEKIKEVSQWESSKR